MAPILSAKEGMRGDRLAWRGRDSPDGGPTGRSFLSDPLGLCRQASATARVVGRGRKTQASGSWRRLAPGQLLWVGWRVVLESVCPARAGPLTKRHAPSRTGPKGLRCLDNPLLQPIAKLLGGWCDSSEASGDGQPPLGQGQSIFCGARHRPPQRVCLTVVLVQTPRGSLFLSAEARRGPQTVNSFGDGSWLSTVERDTTVVVERSAPSSRPISLSVSSPREVSMMTGISDARQICRVTSSPSVPGSPRSSTIRSAAASGRRPAPPRRSLR